MKSERVLLKVGSLYTLHDREGHGQVLECLNVFDSYYSPFCARLRSTITGWTMDCMGTNVYPDGSIDWDFSVNGNYTEYDERGCLHEKRF